MTGHALRCRETSGGKRLALRALHALNKRRLALCFVAAVLMAALSTLSMYSRISLYGIGPERPSAGDAVLWLFMGNALGFSPEWGAVWCLVLVAGAVDVRSLAGGGPGACYVVASGGRGAFWRSLCLVAGLTSALVIVVLAGSIAALAISLGGAPSLAPACIDAISLGDVSGAATAGDVGVLLGLLLAGAASFSLACLAISLRAGRSAALGACVVVLLGSAFLPMAPLPGSWLMVTRLDCFTAGTTVTTAWPPVAGLCELAAIGGVSYVLGAWAFKGVEFGIASPKTSRVRVRSRGGKECCAPVTLLCLCERAPVLRRYAFGRIGRHRAVRRSCGEGGPVCPAGSSAWIRRFSSVRVVGVTAAGPTWSNGERGTHNHGPLWLACVGSASSGLDVSLFGVFGSTRSARGPLRKSIGHVVLSLLGGVGRGLLIFLAEAAACLLATVLTGGAFGATPSSWFADVAGLSRETLPAQIVGVADFALSYGLLCVALALIQLALAEFVGALPALFVLAAYLVGSIFLMRPVLLANFMMAARSTAFVVPWQVEVQEGLLQAGVSPIVGIVVAVLLGALSCFLGLWRATAMEFYGGIGR